jgi:hypothetical protein
MARSPRRPQARRPQARRAADTVPAARRVRRARAWSIAAGWLFVMLFCVGPVFLGYWLFLVPAIGFTLAMVATTRLARDPEGPDAQVLEPGALKRATAQDPVEVRATWSSSAERGRADRGTLRVAGKRLSFTTDTGETRLDAPVKGLRTASVPGFWRPQLDLRVDGATESLRFYPVWDMGATIVGPVVAGEWYHQLRALGAD